MQAWTICSKRAGAQFTKKICQHNTHVLCNCTYICQALVSVKRRICSNITPCDTAVLLHRDKQEGEMQRGEAASLSSRASVQLLKLTRD